MGGPASAEDKGSDDPSAEVRPRSTVGAAGDALPRSNDGRRPMDMEGEASTSAAVFERCLSELEKLEDKSEEGRTRGPSFS